MDVGEAVVAALKFESEFFVINAQEVEDTGVEVMNAYGIFVDVVGIVVGFADRLAGFNAAAGKPHREAARVVVAAKAGGSEVALAVNSAAKFSSPDDEGVIKKASLFEVCDESGGRLVCFLTACGELFLETAVSVPTAVEELHEADAAFAEAAGHKGVVGVSTGLAGVFAIEFEGALGLA